MIQKLRIRFIVIMMTIVTVLLTATFSALYYSTRLNYYQRSMEALRDGLASMGTDRPGTPPQPKDREELPLLVADRMPDGEIHILKNHLLDRDDSEAEALIALADGAENVSEHTTSNDLTGNTRETRSGTLSSEHLRFLCETHRNGTVRYVFADIFQEQNSLHWFVIHSVLIGLGSLFVFFLLAMYLARWSVRPVEEAWKQQRQFVADASHELKTPLTVILSNASMMAASANQLPEKDRRRSEHIHAEALRMKTLIDQMLTLARKDSEETKSEAKAVHVPLDFSYLTNSCIMSMEPLAFEAGKLLESSISDQIMVNGDERNLRQLLEILLDNACKYSEEGSTIAVSLCRRTAKEALLTVTSEGRPLSREEISHIFLRFYRADPSRGNIPGYGLGLSIAWSIVHEHGGKIEASSDGIRKNSFTVHLPLCGTVSRPDEPRSPAQAEKTETSPDR